MSEAHALFCSPINESTVERILQNLTGASQKGVQHLHLLFQSTGGSVNDGICLYNVFAALPYDLTIYNVGSVQSIAALAYLGARKRKTSASATFVFHRTTMSPQFAMAFALQSYAESVSLDDRRTEAILRRHINMPTEKWAKLDHIDLWFTAQEAVEAGIADEIADFAPPVGSQIYYF
jgi:ATP-dependent Clp protease, protease subunit